MSDPRDEDFLKEITDMLDRPAPSSSREPPSAQRRRKKRRRFPFLAVWTVLLAGALLFACFRYMQSRGEQSASLEESIPSGAAADGDTLTIAAAGDINITQALLDSARGADGAYDFSRMLLGAAPLLSGADLTVADLEVNFCGAPYDPERYNAPESLLAALAEAGVDLVQTANTASVYNGIAGLQSTLETIHQAGLLPVGTFATEQEAKQSKGFTMVEVKGFRVAFVAFTKGVGNLRLPEGAERCVNLLYNDYNTTYQDVDAKGIREILSQVQAEGPDITIALLHWGSEYDRAVSKTQEEIRDLMLQGGVDVILGTHSHLVGPVEMTTAQSGTMLTAYGLGDLMSTGEGSDDSQGMVLKLEFTKQGNETSLTGYHCDPIYLAGNGKTGTGAFEVINTRDEISLYESQYVDRVSQEMYETLKQSLEEVEASIKAREQES